MANGWSRGTCLHSQNSCSVRGLCAELTAVQRFEDSLQRQYDGQVRSHVNALQDECREHVGQEADKMRKALQHALTRESSICHDQQQALRQQVCQEQYADAESTREMNQLRQLMAAQAEAMQRFEAHSQQFVSPGTSATA